MLFGSYAGARDSLAIVDRYPKTADAIVDRFCLDNALLLRHCRRFRHMNPLFIRTKQHIHNVVFFWVLSAF